MIVPERASTVTEAKAGADSTDGSVCGTEGGCVDWVRQARCKRDSGERGLQLTKDKGVLFPGQSWLQLISPVFKSIIPSICFDFLAFSPCFQVLYSNFT